MDVKNRLTELINDVLSYLPWGEISSRTASECADHLLANGVCLDSKQAAELPRDFGRWIPVEERKPDTVFCEATGKRYSEAVNVLTSGRKVITAIYDGEDFVGDAEFWWVDEDEVITHWTPVLLPLPD